MRRVIPRIWLIRYSVVVTWLSLKKREVGRSLGERIKAAGKALIASNQDPLPYRDGKAISWDEGTKLTWGRELFEKCSFKAAEVHLQGIVYRGYIDVLFKKFFVQEPALVVVLKDVLQKRNFKGATELLNRKEIKLSCYKEPYVIKDETTDCIYVGFKEGYMVIYFSTPK